MTTNAVFLQEGRDVTFERHRTGIGRAANPSRPGRDNEQKGRCQNGQPSGSN